LSSKTGGNISEETGSELSSTLTWHYRYTIPGILSLLAMVTIGWYSLNYPNLTGVHLALSIIVIAGCVFYSRYLDKGKWISANNHSLVITDRRMKQEIDFTEIEDVHVTPFLKPDRVRIRFSRASVFGKQVFFFPPMYFFKRPAANRTAIELDGLIRAFKEQV
jgi:hypothetical protein